SPSPLVTQAGNWASPSTASTSAPATRRVWEPFEGSQRQRRVRELFEGPRRQRDSAPSEVDTASLCPARFIAPLRVERAARQHGHLGAFDAQAAQVIAYRLRAAFRQREIVLLRAAVVGVANQRHRTADLLHAVG